MSTPGAYTGRMYSRYSEVRPGRHLAGPGNAVAQIRTPVFRKLYLPHVPPNKDARILDIGCGYGEFLQFLQGEGYTATHGIDLNQGELDFAESKGVRNLQCADALEFLQDGREEFDFISALDVLEHIPKHKVLDFLDVVHASLHPGAEFLCQVPNAAAFYACYAYGDFSHETTFTASSLKQVLELANFVDIEVLPCGPVVHGVKSAVRFVLWKAIAAGLTLVQVVEGGGTDPLASMFTGAIYALARRKAAS